MSDTITKALPTARPASPSASIYTNELVDTANVDPLEIFLAAKGTGVKVWVGRNIPGNDVSHVSMTPGDTGLAGLEEVVRRIEALKQPDPVFALIEAHKLLWLAQEAAFVPGVIDPPQTWTDAVNEASDAMQEIADCEPTTLAGCRAAAAYISEHPCNKGFGDTDQIRDAFDTLARALKAVIP